MKHYSTLFVLGIFILASQISICQSYVMADMKDKNQPIIFHQVQRGENLYHISKMYHVSVAAIKALNDLKSSNLSIDQHIMIPFNSEALYYEAKGATSQIDYAPVLYRVKRKENLYRICKHHFDLPISRVKELNDLRSNNLDLDQELILGWIFTNKLYEDRGPAESTTEEVVVEEVIAIGPENNPYTPVQVVHEHLPADLESETENIVSPWEITGEETGAAIWDKNMPNGGDYFMLHKYAKVGSWVDIINPMFGKHIRCQIIGRIPPNMYVEDPLIIVNPKLAKDLGALDSRFYVKVRYLRSESMTTSTD